MFLERKTSSHSRLAFQLFFFNSLKKMLNYDVIIMLQAESIWLISFLVLLFSVCCTAAKEWRRFVLAAVSDIKSFTALCKMLPCDISVQHSAALCHSPIRFYSMFLSKCASLFLKIKCIKSKWEYVQTADCNASSYFLRWIFLLFLLKVQGTAAIHQLFAFEGV